MRALRGQILHFCDRPVDGTVERPRTSHCRGARRASPLVLGSFASVLLLVGCRSAPKSIDEALRSDDAVDRVRAVRGIAEAEDRSRLPDLVERLQDDDEVVRFYAIVALERMTGTRRGYSYAASPGQRAPAVAEWRKSVGLPVDSGPSEPDKQATSEAAKGSTTASGSVD